MKRFLQLVFLILLAAGAQPAYSALWQWSKTTASNAGADPTINWAEGMSPSSVNDSARAMMARMAEYRDDISGLLATTGGPTAFAVTTNQGLNATPNDGQMISATINATNGASATLVADGGTAFPIQSAAGAAAPAATLISGSPYTFKFSAANSAWMLKEFYGSSLTVPLGGLVPYTGATAPNSNFILPAGQCISTTTYAAYWVLLGSPASGSCSGGQFQVIDLRGRNLVGLDNLNGTAANRLTTVSYGCGTLMNSVGAVCANGLEYQTLTLAQTPAGIGSSTGGAVTVQSTTGNKNFPVTAGPISSAPVPSSGSLNAPWSGSGSPDWATSNTMTTSGAVFSVSTNTGGQPHPIVQPTIAVTYLLRVI